MKFRFKIQDYQTTAVENTVAVFSGQPSYGPHTYRRDIGKNTQGGVITYEDEYLGYRNHDIELTPLQLLDNIRKVQSTSDIPMSNDLEKPDGMGACSLDIEMETGTGKTYVYIKTIFEFNKLYGWSKFIVVVPSIAIREGVNKSFSMLEEHFLEQYGKKARYFVYNSSNLNELDQFASDSNINVMIINTQAFASSLKEGSRDKNSRIIYSKQDSFGSRRPIDVLAANRPIIIMDEPQKMEGEATQTGLKRFNPLFILNYSATHKTKHNTVYALDAVDAYREKLVKRIQVKGFELKNLKGTNSYLYLDDIMLFKNKAPEVKIELEIKYSSGIKRERRTFGKNGNLLSVSNLKEYEGYVISDINPYTNTVTFLNGVTIRKGEVIGDVSEITLQRVQIRETIRSHFEKEQELFENGIKTLSLFFIDEVSKYKSYDKDGNEVKGIFQTIFEEEYQRMLDEKLSLFSSAYQEYLRKFDVTKIHNGYFSIDKKSGHAIDSVTSRRSDISDDISAYDLILKNKEQLLNFDEPTRFIFSHSALREGWDNPNVFQICTLRHSNSAINKRQEVGRGLRLCVDRNGNRMDKEALGELVHQINRLTVIANESYSTFVDELQKRTRETLRERPDKINLDFFKRRSVKLAQGYHTISDNEAMRIILYLEDSGYIDSYGKVTGKYKDESELSKLAPLPHQVEYLGEAIHAIIQSTYDSYVALETMIEDGNKTLSPENKLNDRYYSKEFQALWQNINHKYVYTVHYSSDELIRNVVSYIDHNLYVTELKYIMTTGDQSAADLFENTKTTTKSVGDVSTSTVRYDLVGEIARGANLTRRTVVAILKGILPAKLAMFRNNPEEFIRKVTLAIREQKSTMIVEHIRYDRLTEEYDSAIFTEDKHSRSWDKAYPAKKHILDYVFTDGIAKESTELKFAKAMDSATEVCVYAKLPRSFKIPTPVGDYSPDWAIAFKKGTVKHIFFVAETKGSMSDFDIRGVEHAKIECAKKLFNDISTSNVRYDYVDSYQSLLDVINSMD